MIIINKYFFFTTLKLIIQMTHIIHHIDINTEDAEHIVNKLLVFGKGIYSSDELVVNRIQFDITGDYPLDNKPNNCVYYHIPDVQYPIYQGKIKSLVGGDLSLIMGDDGHPKTCKYSNLFIILGKNPYTEPAMLHRIKSVTKYELYDIVKNHVINN